MKPSGATSLQGKRGLVVGIANETSIAARCARAFVAAGAELAATYLNDKARPYVDAVTDLDTPVGQAINPVVSVGTVVSVRGAVVDISFVNKLLPPINSALVVEWDRPEPLVLEVHSHVDPVTVRGIALQATGGLARGMPVRATMEPISVPVGQAVLGRLLDVVGTVRDRGPALPSDTPRRGIHNSPPALEDETSATEVFETGIKVIDLLAPLAQGGKAAMFGGAGVGKTCWSWS